MKHDEEDVSTLIEMGLGTGDWGPVTGDWAGTQWPVASS